MTRQICCIALLSAVPVAASDSPTRSLGLREAVRLAMGQSPEVQLATIESEKADRNLAVIRAERSARVHAGSGLGATYGIPQSIQGSVPSVAQLTLSQPLLDTGRARRADSARESVAADEHAAEAAAERSVYRAGIHYLDFEAATRGVQRLTRELEHFERMERRAVHRVEEGVEIPLTLSRARLETARARERLAAAQDGARLLESDLKRALGIGHDVSLQPEMGDDMTLAVLADAARTAVGRPLDDHPEMASLEAGLRAAQHDVRAARSRRLPTLDVVGQYALLARFNNYDDFFRRFQRHNWQAGVALQVPVFAGRDVSEQIARARLAEREIALRQTFRREDLERDAERARIALGEAERLAELARLELSFARESLDVVLARFEESTAGISELERARYVESKAWGGLIESRYALAKAQLGVLHSAGVIRKAFAD